MGLLQLKCGSYRFFRLSEPLCPTQAGTLNSVRPRDYIKAGDRIRTDDVQLGKLVYPPSKSSETKDIPEDSSAGSPKESPKLQETVSRDADLAAVIAAWTNLPDHIKTTILVLVKSAGVPNDASE